MRLHAALLLAFLVTSATAAATPSRTQMQRDLANMKSQLATLTDYVKKLESRLEAQEKTAPAPAPADKGAGDPLAEAEAEVAAATQKGAPVAKPAPDADPLVAMEREVAAAKATQAPTGNPRTAFNPQISAVGDFVYSNSSLDEDPAGPDVNGNPLGDRNRDRFSVREVEIALQAAIDPFSRADIFLAFPGVLEEFEDDAAEAREQKVEVEEAYITYWRLPWGMQLKGGKFRLEFGKNNRVHDHDMNSTSRPLAITNFLGGEGIAEQGLSLQGFIPIGGPSTQLELTGQILNGEGGEETLFAGAGSDKTMALGRARLYHDFSSSHNVDVGTSFLAGRHDAAGRFRQSVVGADFTYRYEPVSQNLYKQFLFRGEYLQGRRRVPVDEAVDLVGFEDLDGDGILDPDGIDDTAVDRIASHRPSGYYLEAQYYWDRFWNVGMRHERTDTALRTAPLTLDPDPLVRDRALAAIDRIEANTIWVTYLTSEFNRWRIEYSNRDTNFALDNNKTDEHLLSLQWIFAMGPHGSHKY